jgi:hypothetical protein
MILCFELGSLKRVLRHLEAIELTEENVHHINALRGMALACQFPLQDFLSRIAKYESFMSPSPGALHGIFRKSQYVLSFAADVQQLRGVVAGKVANANLLFGFAQRVGLSGRDIV